MKNLISGLTFTAVALLYCGVSMAQQQVADTKPKIASTKTATAEEKPAISPNGLQTDLEKKVITEPQNSKPVIPGGEFKPRDTRDIQYPVKTIEQTSKPTDTKLPELQTALASKKQQTPAPVKQSAKPMLRVADQ